MVYRRGTVPVPAILCHRVGLATQHHLFFTRLEVWAKQQTTHATEAAMLMSLAERLCSPEATATARERDECARALLASAAAATAVTTTRAMDCAWTVAHVAVLLTPLRRLLANSGDDRGGAEEGARALHTHVASVRMRVWAFCTSHRSII